jgi:hypothetical protein
MLYAATLSREQFLDWLGANNLPEARKIPGLSSLEESVRGDRIALLWDEKPTKQVGGQPIVVTRSKEIREFLAFTSTYVSSYLPFSAFFRVATLEALGKSALNRGNEQTSKRLPDAVVGVAMAEAHAQMKGRAQSLSDISVQACLATLSSSAIAGLKLGYGPDEILSIGQSWTRARKLVSDEPLGLRSEDVQTFWYQVGCALRANEVPSAVYGCAPLICDAIRDVLVGGAIAESTWNELTSNLPDLRQAPHQMKGPREDRIRLFDQYVRVLNASEHADKNVRELVAGQVASLVADGSFDYIGLTGAFDRSLPAAPLWFGFFSSLRSPDDALAAGGCLGRRLARDLPRELNLFAPPTDDIALDELEVISGGPAPELRFRTEHRSALSVEIYPGVSARFRMSRASEPNDPNRAFTTEQTQELQFLLSRASRIVDRLLGPSQGSLFSDRPQRQRGSRYRERE